MVQGKKNKVPKAKTSNSTTIEAEEADRSPISGGWAQALKERSPEEQAIEAEKQKQRNDKAAIAAQLQQKQNEKSEWFEKERQKTDRKKNQDDRKWDAKLEKDKEKALKEGILEAQEGIDGLWYVELAPKTWRECSGQYFCSLCEKHLNDLTLTAHLESDGHRKKREWLLPESASTSPTPPTHPANKVPRPVAPASQSTSWCAPCNNDAPLEDWQERGADGYARCKPCGKLCDGMHENSAAHIDKLEWWRYRQQTEKNGYEAPDLQYLAYVPFDDATDPNGPRGLRCLMCKKWVNDEWSHTGTHSNPDGSKEHQKNLRNYGPGNQWWEEEVVKVRQRWHPMQKKLATVVKKQATLAPWATTEHVAAASSNTTSTLSRQPETKEDLPEGWSAHLDDTGNTFYFHEASAQSTWDVPKNGQELQKKSQEDTLPPGWQMVVDDTGHEYYFNEATNETQWEPPQLEVLWKEAKDGEGSTYYYNLKTGETSWDKPEGF